MKYTVCFMAEGGLTVEAGSAGEAISLFEEERQDDAMEELSLNGVTVTDVFKEEDQMNSYLCTVTEELSRTVAIKASSEEEALETLQKLYKDEEIVLSADDYVETALSCRKAAESEDLSAYDCYTKEGCLEGEGGVE